jgi:hypothetical protein
MQPSTLRDVLLVIGGLPLWKFVLALSAYNVGLGFVYAFFMGFLKGLGLT